MYRLANASVAALAALALLIAACGDGSSGGDIPSPIANATVVETPIPFTPFPTPLPGVRPSLRSGMRGRDVAWLRGRLAEILGQHADLENADLFDERLKERVIAFQKNHRLKRDGIVGTMTQIQLAGAIGGSAVPRLRKRP